MVNGYFLTDATILRKIINFFFWLQIFNLNLDMILNTSLHTTFIFKNTRLPVIIDENIFDLQGQ